MMSEGANTHQLLLGGKFVPIIAVSTGWRSATRSQAKLLMGLLQPGYLEIGLSPPSERPGRTGGRMQLPRLKSSDWNSLTGVLSPFQTCLLYTSDAADDWLVV